MWLSSVVAAEMRERMVEREALKVAEVAAGQAVEALRAFRAPGGEGPDKRWDAIDRFMTAITRDGGVSAAGYATRWLCENGGGQRLDTFERAALATQHAVGPGERMRPMWSLQQSGGRRVLRYVTGAWSPAPDAMSSTMPAAAIEVIVPLDEADGFASLQVRGPQGLLVIVVLASVAAIAWLAVRSVRRERELARRFEGMAATDALTGLPNRIALARHLEAVLASGAIAGRGIAILFIDVDNFKTINDSLGHDKGDAVLEVIAERIEGCIGSSDFVCRYSGDEFVVVLDEGTDLDDVRRLAAVLVDAASPPVIVRGREIFVTLSVGIACAPRDGSDGASLLKHADAAMYSAKERGRNGFAFFDPDMDRSAQERLQMSGNLRWALARNEFVVHYQPKVDGRDGAIVGFEALVRWAHPTQGIIGPAHFIPHAERSGMIEHIGQWVLLAALRQLRRLRDAHGFTGTMAVNLSMRQLYNEDLPAMVALALADAGVSPDRLELEVTESMVSERPEMAARVLGELHATGISIALDDFGTGQSSLSSLLRFPITTLKVDKSFTSELDGRPHAEAVVGAVIALARALDLRLVAEGVETERQHAYYRREGFDEIQGYLVGWPMPPEEVGSFLSRHEYRSSGPNAAVTHDP